MKQKLDKRPSKPVEYALIGQNCVAGTLAPIMRDMTQKQMNVTHGYDTKTGGHYKNQVH